MAASLTEVGNDLVIVHFIPATLATASNVPGGSWAEGVAAVVVVGRFLRTQALADGYEARQHQS